MVLVSPSKSLDDYFAAEEVECVVDNSLNDTFGVVAMNTCEEKSAKPLDDQTCLK